jgi:gliding motility-associated lipoprotein GldH
MKLQKIRRTFFHLLTCVVFIASFSSCNTVDLYEKTATIPGHSWKSDFKPSFTFKITDTVSPYQLFFTIRHEDRYNYNNIYVKINTRLPGEDSFHTAPPYNLQLGNNETGWLGAGMDDIYEHLVPLTPQNRKFYFRKAGEYTFTVEHMMREDPLQHVLNVGIRVQKSN